MADIKFTNLLIDTARGCVENYDKNPNEAIRTHFFEVLGIEPTKDVKTIRRAFRKNKAEVYEIIEDTIEEMLITGWGDNPFFRDLVEVNNLRDGDQNEFYVPDDSILTVSKFSGNHHDINYNSVRAA